MTNLTLGNIKTQVNKLIDNTADSQAVTFWANTAQMQIATSAAKIPASKTIVQNMPNNILPSSHSPYETYTYTPPQTYSFSVEGGRAFYIEICGSATVSAYIFDDLGEIVQLYSQTVSSSEEFFPLRASFVSITDNTELYITLTSSSSFLYRNFAVYNRYYDLSAEVPAFGKYIGYDMPENFFELSPSGILVVNNSGNTDGISQVDYKWYQTNKLLLKRALKGEFIIHYYRYPSVITEETSDSYEFEVSPAAQTAIPYFVAAQMVSGENPTLFANLMNEFELILSRLATPQMIGKIDLINELGW